MKAIILAAGYGTRLENDIKRDASGLYSCLIGLPKPLIPISGQPLISHWMRTLEVISEIDKIIVITNGCNYKTFKEWAKDWPQVELISDGTTRNEDRIGAVACMNLGVQQFKNDDVVFIGGDTLFKKDFNLRNIIEEFKQHKLKDSRSNVILSVNCSEEDVSKYGIIEVNKENCVTKFLEKPSPEQTSSRKHSPCFYILSKDSLNFLQEFIDKHAFSPLKEKDAPGNFISFLVSCAPVFVYQVSGRYDIGCLQSYLYCAREFLSHSLEEPSQN